MSIFIVPKDLRLAAYRKTYINFTARFAIIRDLYLEQLLVLFTQINKNGIRWLASTILPIAFLHGI